MKVYVGQRRSRSSGRDRKNHGAGPLLLSGMGSASVRCSNCVKCRSGQPDATTSAQAAPSNRAELPSAPEPNDLMSETGGTGHAERKRFGSIGLNFCNRSAAVIGLIICSAGSGCWICAGELRLITSSTRSARTTGTRWADETIDEQSTSVF